MVDAGDLLTPSTVVPDADRDERMIKAELLLDGISRTGVDAMTLGRKDFGLGRDFLFQQAKARGLPYYCANLVDRSTGEPVFPASAILGVGKIKVGIFGLADQGLEVEGLEVLDPVKVARRTAADLRKNGATLVVALSNQASAENEKLAKKVPEIGIIVSASSGRMLDPPDVVGDTLIVEAGSRGKNVGILELTLEEGGTGWADLEAKRRSKERAERFYERMRGAQSRLLRSDSERESARLRRQIEMYEKEIREAEQPDDPGHITNKFVNRLVPLGQEVADDPEMAAILTTALDQIARGQGAAWLASNDIPTGRVPEEFLGAEACKICHEQAYQQWQTTAHANAYETLAGENRQFDSQCVECHVTGYGQPAGPSSPHQVGILRNVQCEACHGPGRRHVDDPSLVLSNGPLDETLCRTCHSGEQWGGRFDFAAYLPRVRHIQAQPSEPVETQVQPSEPVETQAQPSEPVETQVRP